MKITRISIQTPAELMKQNANWLMGLGVLMIVLGSLGMWAVTAVTMMSMMVVGALFILASLAQWVDVFWRRHWNDHGWRILVACLYLFIGWVMIREPAVASEVLTLYLAIFLILIGMIRILVALSSREFIGWKMLLIVGISSLVLGVLILMQWPSSALWVIGLIVVLELLISGWSYVFIGFALKRLS